MRRKIGAILFASIFVWSVNANVRDINNNAPVYNLYMEETKKQKIMEVLNVFETGSKKGNYAAISIFSDGPNDMRQITYGRSQTTEFGNLKELIKDYVAANGKYSDDLEEYVDRIGKRPSLQTNSKFKDLLRKAGKDSVMHKVQDDFFTKRYWKPAKKWFEKNNFEHPLSMLVVYDSYIHSGGILSFLRKRFSATPENEKEWIRQYVETRHNWLKSHRRPILRKTIYRTNLFKALLRDENWGMNKSFRAQGVAWVADSNPHSVEIVEETEEQPRYIESLEIKLPSASGISEFYEEEDYLAWFSFPIEVKVPSGAPLTSRVGDGRSDYVCHHTLKGRIETALKEIYDLLGDKDFKKEGWDIFGGGYVKDGTPAERWAVQFIFDPANTESEQKFNDDAVDIMEKYGFLNLGRATGKDFGTFVAYVPDYKGGDYYKKLGLPKNIKTL